nr:pectin acetylesterase 8-like [Ipomoea batatas]
MGTKVKCLADAGYFINALDISHAPHIEEFYSDIVQTHASAKNLPLSCTLRLKPSLVRAVISRIYSAFASYYMVPSHTNTA